MIQRRIFNNKTLVETPVETPVEPSHRQSPKTPDRILSILAEHPSMTLAEVATAIGMSVSAVERAAKKLTGEGRLRHVGPRKGGQWEILP